MKNVIDENPTLREFALQLANDTRFPAFVEALIDEQAGMMRNPRATLEDLQAAHLTVQAIDALRARIMRVKSDNRMAERRSKG